MRKFVWLAGAIGLVGLAISAGTAQESSLPMPSSYRAAMQAQTQNRSTPSPTQAAAARMSREAAPATQPQPTPRRGGLSLLGGRRPTTAAPSASTATAQTQDIQRYQRTRSFAAQGAPTTSAAPSTATIPAYTPQQREAVTGLRNYGTALFGPATASPSAQPAPTPAPQAVVGQDYAAPSATAPRSGLPTSPPADLTTAAAPQPLGTNPLMQIPQPAVQPAPIQNPIQPTGVIQPSATNSGVISAEFSQPRGSAEVIQPVSGANAAAPLPEFGAGPIAEETPVLPEASSLTQPIATPSIDAPIRQPSQITELRRPVAQPRRSIPAGANFSSRTPHVKIEWKKHGDINVGQPCEVELIVTNDGDATAAEVGVDAWFPPTVRLTETVPEPVAATDIVSWRFDRLDAGEQRSIMILLIPAERGEITASANVHFTSSVAKTFSVDEPMLSLAIQGPEKVLLGEPASQIVTVSNPGTGVAQNVVVEVQLPEGLQHPKGNRLKMELGSLSAGESRSVRLTLTAQDGGQQPVQVIAKAGTGLEKSTAANVMVLAPSLQLALEGPSVRYVGRDARYTLTATNDGLAVTNNVRSMYLVPEGFDFVYASRGGKYDARTRTVSWFIGSVAPGDKVEMALKLKPIQLGEFSHVARVLSEHGASAEAQSTTSIQGTASLMLEVADLDDPVETGRDTAYEIKVRNDGSKGAQNVGLSVELPPGIEMLNIQGPTEFIAESGLIVFKAMPSLAAGKTATFRIQIKGSEEGNQRIRARLTSDSIQEPLTVEELTRFYAD